MPHEQSAFTTSNVLFFAEVKETVGKTSRLQSYKPLCYKYFLEAVLNVIFTYTSTIIYQKVRYWLC